MYVFIRLASLGGGPQAMYAHYGYVGAIPIHRVYRLSDRCQQVRKAIATNNFYTYHISSCVHFTRKHGKRHSQKQNMKTEMDCTGIIVWIVGIHIS